VQTDCCSHCLAEKNIGVHFSRPPSRRWQPVHSARLQQKPFLPTFMWISIVKPTRCINVSNLFYWSNTLHVSDVPSVHHQELKTVHTATGICQTAGTRWNSKRSSISRHWCIWLVSLLKYITMHGPMNVKFHVIITARWLGGD